MSQVVDFCAKFISGFSEFNITAELADEAELDEELLELEDELLELKDEDELEDELLEREGSSELATSKLSVHCEINKVVISWYVRFFI